MDKPQQVRQLIEQLNNYRPFSVYPRGTDKTHLLRKENLSAEAKNLSKINALVIGQVGVGKSSYISTVYRTLNDAYDGAAVATVGKGYTKSITQKKKCYLVNKNRTIIMHDTKGLENLLQQELDVVEAQLTKRLKDDVAVEQKKDADFWEKFFYLFNSAALLDPEIFDKGPPTINDIPHVVIVVLAANSEGIPVQMANFIKKLERHRYVPLYLITKCDVGEAVGDACGMLQNFTYKKKQLLEFLKKNSLGSSSPKLEDDIMICPNYTHWGIVIEPVIGIDYQAVLILQEAIKRAEDWLEQQHYSKSCIIS